MTRVIRTVSRLFQSTIFRLTLLYTGFFFFSFLLLLAFIYFATVREMKSEIKHRISAEMNEAKAEFNRHGKEALERQISAFLEDEDEGLAVYLFLDGENKVLAGNMENWPQDVEYSEGWLLFDVESRRLAEGVHVLAKESPLPGGYRLLVGYSLRGPDRTKHAMFNVASVSFLLAFFITGFGATAFSSVIRRRLAQVNQICEQVIGGNLDVKVPLTGGADEFDHLSVNVNAMLERMGALVGGLRQTSDNIAHDLRTPLARHRNHLEAMLTHPPRQMSKVQEFIKAGLEEVDNILETLNSILRISQAQSGVASGHFVTFDISAVMIDVVEFYDELAAQKNIVIRGSVPLEIQATGDKPLITQAIANLLDNAIKYTPDGGQINVALTRQGQEIECTVADNGPGIPAEYYDKVKERFFRMEASRTSKGTGLGLSLVDAVAHLHRGELVLGDNAPGLTALLRFPIGAG